MCLQFCIVVSNNIMTSHMLCPEVSVACFSVVMATNASVNGCCLLIYQIEVFGKHTSICCYDFVIVTLHSNICLA